MARLAFFLDTRRIAGTDVSSVESGNPGIGGTEYVFLLVAARLGRRHDVLMCTTTEGPYPPSVRHVAVRDMQEAAAAATAAGAQLFVVRENAVLPNLRLIESLTLPVIVWAHNFSKPDTLRACARTPQVARYLCVSREQLAMLRHEAIASKAVFIFNPVVTAACPAADPPSGTDNVVYMGSLVKSKGFHILARHWPEVVDAVPTARLHVVGSGRLYDQDADLGPLGLASPDYEKMFSKFVTRRGACAMTSSSTACSGPTSGGCLRRRRLRSPIRRVSARPSASRPQNSARWAFRSSPGGTAARSTLSRTGSAGC